MSQVSKVVGLSANGNKEAVRGLIAAQLIEARTRGFIQNGREGMCGLTLPGTEFGFERLVWALCQTKGIEANFDGVEYTTDVFAHALEHKPPYCTLSLAKFETVLADDMDFNAAGIGKDKSPFICGMNDNRYDFMWADYCGKASSESMNALAKYLHRLPMHEMDGFIMYATYSVGRGRESMTDLHGYAPSKSQPQIIMDTFKHLLQGLPHKVVLHVQYQGGDGYHCPMFTVGIAFGKARGLNPIHQNLHGHSGTTYYQALRKSITAIKTNPEAFRLDAKPAKPCKAQPSKSGASTEVKDAVEKTARTMIRKYVNVNGCDVKELNLAVFKTLRPLYPNLTLGSVSATITTRVTYRERFAKSVKARQAA